MAILQKLETSYLAILRFVVIVISGLLLVATLILSVTALVNLRDGPESGQSTPKVTPDQIVKDLTKTQAKSGAPITRPSSAQATQAPVDPNHAEYERAANIIVSFVSRYGRGEEVPKDAVIRVVKNRVETQPTPELIKACASGLPGILEKVLLDKKVVELVSRPVWSESSDDLQQHDMTVGRSPVWVANMVLDQYFAMFKQQVDQAMVDEEIERSGQAIRKEQAMQNLYMAAAAFGAFLLLALLAIIVRVERNLRPLAHLADKAQESK